MLNSLGEESASLLRGLSGHGACLVMMDAHVAALQFAPLSAGLQKEAEMCVCVCVCEICKLDL